MRIYKYSNFSTWNFLTQVIAICKLTTVRELSTTIKYTLTLKWGLNL